MDEGSPRVMIPKQFLLKFGITPKLTNTSELFMSDGPSSQAWNVKIGVRLKTTNNELIALHEVML